MKIQLIRILAAFLAGVIVMIIHEFPKAYLYNKINPKQGNQRKRNIYKLHHYIDPIGMVLCITNQAGFSKPYMYRIKDKKTNIYMGTLGLFTLLMVFTISMSILHFGLGITADLRLPENIGTFNLIFQVTLVHIALISLSMFIVNLFPIATFDMGLCIAGVSTSKYFTIIKNDYFIKIMVILVIMFQFVTSFSTLTMTHLL
ncbi:MAG: hypothetical protein K0S61_247 [Anaerocolumna sp.]|jgi:hypothetical protein|nr:hypothetical protein [Anaerocolumna sp.]